MKGVIRIDGLDYDWDVPDGLIAATLSGAPYGLSCRLQDGREIVVPLRLIETLRPNLALISGPRYWTEMPVGPVELLAMVLGRELHDREEQDCSWWDHTGSTVTSFCRRACEARGIDWKWVMAAITRERGVVEIERR